MIVYLHGFNSLGWGNKSKTIAKNYDGEVFAPDYPAHDPDKAITFLQQYLSALKQKNLDTNEILLVGSSMGGFYANWLAQTYGYKCVLINPSITPWVTLTQYIGENSKFESNEKYTFTKEMLAASKTYAFDPANTRKVSRLVLLDKGDELLDYRETENLFKHIAKIITYENGDHRFAHMEEATPEIIGFMQ